MRVANAAWTMSLSAWLIGSRVFHLSTDVRWTGKSFVSVPGKRDLPHEPTSLGPGIFVGLLDTQERISALVTAAVFLRLAEVVVCLEILWSPTLLTLLVVPASGTVLSFWCGKADPGDFASTPTFTFPVELAWYGR